MTPPPVPLTLRLVTAVVLAEALLVCGYAVFLAVDPAAAGGWRVIGYYLLYALAFAGLGWALVRRRRWVRAPLIVVQPVLVLAGLALLRSGAPVPGVLVIALAAACVVLLLMPGTREGLGAR